MYTPAGGMSHSCTMFEAGQLGRICLGSRQRRNWWCRVCTSRFRPRYRAQRDCIITELATAVSDV